MTSLNNSEDSLRVYITPKVIDRIFAYARACDIEISGFGAINPVSGVVDRLFPLMEQECSAGETEIADSVLTQLTRSGQSKEVRVWWHSHVNGSAFFSSIDDTCIDGLCPLVQPLVSIVVNKREEYKARVDYGHPYRLTAGVQLVKRYPPTLNSEQLSQIQAEIGEKVKERKYPLTRLGVSQFPFDSDEELPFGIYGASIEERFARKNLPETLKALTMIELRSLGYERHDGVYVKVKK